MITEIHFILFLSKAVRTGLTDFEITIDIQQVRNIIKKRHYKIFCVNGKYGTHAESRIFYLKKTN